MLSVLVGKTVPLCVFCRVQELFSWLIEVDGSVDEGDRGRVVFTLEYEMARGRREEYAPVRNKAVAFVSFQQDSTLAVLPVVKVCIYLLDLLAPVPVIAQECLTSCCITL